MVPAPAPILWEKTGIARTSRAAHFMGLDGLRGVAAFVVVAFHRRAWIGDGAVSHGYLAVDFFFVLSGFVIACAYSRRLREGQITFADFLRLRAIRLWPLVLLGATLGAAVQAAQSFAAGNAGLGWGFVAAWLPQSFLIPVTWLDGPFQVNIPAWSLFFEVIGNLLFAMYFVHFAWRKLVAATVIISALLCINMFLIVDRSAEFTLGYLYFGVIRMGAPFLVGVIIHGLWLNSKLPRLRAPFWLLLLVVIATACVPKLSGAFEPAYRLVCTFIVYPAVLIAGVQSEPQGRWLGFARISAELSYPVYILHLPLLMAFAALHGEHPAMSQVLLVGEMVVVALFALTASRWFDTPIRERLAKCR